MEDQPEETEEEGVREGAGTPRRKERTYSVHVLPSNRHPFQVHFDLLRRFVTMARNGEGVGAAQVEGSGIPIQAASMNVRFLRSIGLLTAPERGKYAPTQEAIRFVNARSVSDERAKPILAAVIGSTWFADLARSIFSTQPIMSEDQFLGELAIAAQTDKTKEEPALRVILDYLVYAGVVTRDERGLSMGSGAPGRAVSTEETTTSRPETKGSAERVVDSSGWHVLQTEDFYIKVRSDLSVVEDLEDHLETIKKKIRRLRGESTSKVSPNTMVEGLVTGK